MVVSFNGKMADCRSANRSSILRTTAIIRANVPRLATRSPKPRGWVRFLPSVFNILRGCDRLDDPIKPKCTGSDAGAEPAISTNYARSTSARSHESPQDGESPSLATRSNMLRVTVEMVPFGIESRKRTISTMEIVNTVGLATKYANYDVSVEISGEKTTTKVKRFWRSRGAWNLIRKILNDNKGFQD